MGIYNASNIPQYLSNLDSVIPPKNAETPRKSFDRFVEENREILPEVMKLWNFYNVFKSQFSLDYSTLEKDQLLVLINLFNKKYDKLADKDIDLFFKRRLIDSDSIKEPKDQFPVFKVELQKLINRFSLQTSKTKES